jgi:hypothetical protein
VVFVMPTISVPSRVLNYKHLLKSWTQTEGALSWTVNSPFWLKDFVHYIMDNYPDKKNADGTANFSLVMVST